MRRFLLACLAVLMSGFTLPVFAQDSDFIKPGHERFTFGLGAVLNSFGTDVRINNPNGSQGSWQGGFEYRYWGPQLYAKARF